MYFLNLYTAVQAFNNLPDWAKVLIVLIVITVVGAAGYETLQNASNFASKPSEQSSETSDLKTIKITVRTRESQPIEGVKVEIIADGAPIPEMSDRNGYVEFQIPSRDRNTVKVVLTKGNKTSTETISLESNPNKTIPIYLDPEQPQNKFAPSSRSNINPSNNKDKESVVKNGRWWAKYYCDDFGAYITSGEFPEQESWGSRLGKDWGWYSRPPELKDKCGKFSIRFVAKRHLEQGRYNFHLNADDRGRVKVNGDEIIVAWAPGSPGSGTKNGDFDSMGGWHNIEVDYMDDGGAAGIKLDWEKIAN